MSAILDSELGQVAAYTCMGTGRRVGVTLAGGAISQTVAGAGGCPGLDRFGRIRDLHYLLAGGATANRHEYGHEPRPPGARRSGSGRSCYVSGMPGLCRKPAAQNAPNSGRTAIGSHFRQMSGSATSARARMCSRSCPALSWPMGVVPWASSELLRALSRPLSGP